jgi:cell wall-associated NlpC family hydrolase
MFDAAALQVYLAGLSALPPDQWQIPFHIDPNLSPRQMLEIAANPVVLGEDCRGKRHFDCVGFINYCIEMALGRVRPVTFEIVQWADGISGTVDVPKDAPFRAADLLIQDFHHIGMLTGDGQVVQAAETKSGVIIGPYNSAGWSRRRRLTAGLLHA